MKSFISSVLAISFSLSMYSQHDVKPNELVKFLEGSWHNYTISIGPGVPVEKDDYAESMQIKDKETIMITAHKYKDGEDLQRDMKLILNENEIIMRQGNFEARGKKEGNVYYLKGVQQGKEYRFRLYTLEDKYIFHSETWKDGKVEHINMSYLVRTE